MVVIAFKGPPGHLGARDSTIMYSAMKKHACYDIQLCISGRYLFNIDIFVNESFMQEMCQII